MIWAAFGIVAIAFAGLLWLSWKIGDAVRGKASTDALTDINNALRPIEPDDIKRVREKYRRD